LASRLAIPNAAPGWRGAADAVVIVRATGTVLVTPPPDTVTCPLYVPAFRPPIAGVTFNVKGAVPEPAESTSHGWSLDPMKESVPAPVFVMLTLAGATLELPACPAKRKLGGLTARTAGTADELVGLTVKTTVALLLESALLVAVTSILVAELTLGAVNKPDALTVPAVADHVTAVFGCIYDLGGELPGTS
jgi:hypothetical protein